MNNIDSVIYLKRSELAKAVFEEYRITWTLAGLLIVAVGNFLTIFSYGLFKEAPPAMFSMDNNIYDKNDGKAMTDRSASRAL
eukprot:7932538-Pyramimonas_sp.AAC.1